MAAGAPPCTRGCRSLKSARRASFQGVQVPQDVFGPTVVDELLTTTACAGVNTSERVRSCAMMWATFPGTHAGAARSSWWWRWTLATFVESRVGERCSNAARRNASSQTSLAIVAGFGSPGLLNPTQAEDVADRAADRCLHAIYASASGHAASVANLALDQLRDRQRVQRRPVVATGRGVGSVTLPDTRRARGGGSP
jgi:hypothetical protein